MSNLDQLAEDLAGAWRAMARIPLPPAERAPRSRAEAYAAQDRMAALVGGEVIGWKVGAMVPAVRMFEGHDGPIPGRVFADRVYGDANAAPAALAIGAKVECEAAFELTEALPPDGAPFTTAALRPVLTFRPAIEMSGSRYLPGTGNRAMTTHDSVADNGNGCAVALGERVADWQALDFETMAVDARIDGHPLQAYSGPYRRDPLDVMAETLNDLAARGVALTAGMVVLTGSLTLPTPIRPGMTLTARMGESASLTFKVAPAGPAQQSET